MRALELRPIRNDVEWLKDEKGRVIIFQNKNLGKFERFLKKLVGGTDVLKRPLDDKGTDIWDLCDGKHTVEDICRDMSNRYKEAIEPVYERVPKFLKILAVNKLIRFEG